MKPGLVGRDAARRLSGLAAHVPAHQAIVEVGVFLARTTVFLARGARAGNGAHVFGVDPWDLPGERYPYKWLNHPRKGKTRQMFTQPSTRLAAEEAVAESGLADGITLIQGFSVEVASVWEGPEIGLLLIDGDHRADHVQADWEAWHPHLAEGAVVAWDDYHRDYPGVKSTVDGLVAEGVVAITEVVPRRNSALALSHVVDP